MLFSSCPIVYLSTRKQRKLNKTVSHHCVDKSLFLAMFSCFQVETVGWKLGQVPPLIVLPSGTSTSSFRTPTFSQAQPRRGLPYVHAGPANGRCNERRMVRYLPLCRGWSTKKCLDKLHLLGGMGDSEEWGVAATFHSPRLFKLMTLLRFLATTMLF
jgi:hypothetical protein